jgi:hypothetical protein
LALIGKGITIAYTHLALALALALLVALPPPLLLPIRHHSEHTLSHCLY